MIVTDVAKVKFNWTECVFADWCISSKTLTLQAQLWCSSGLHPTVHTYLWACLQFRFLSAAGWTGWAPPGGWWSDWSFWPWSVLPWPWVAGAWGGGKKRSWRDDLGKKKWSVEEEKDGYSGRQIHIYESEVRLTNLCDFVLWNCLKVGGGKCEATVSSCIVWEKF